MSPFDAAARAHPASPVAALVLAELRQVRALWLLVRRRTDTEHPADATVSYGAGRGQVYLALGAVCIVELVVVHVAVPWDRLGDWSWLRWVVLGLSAYGAVWVLAWWAAQRTHPHLITDDELVVRNGAGMELRVPLADIAAASPRRRSEHGEERFVLGGLGGDTNLDVELRAPTAVRGRTGRDARRVTALSLDVDDPGRATEQLTTASAEAELRGGRA